MRRMTFAGKFFVSLIFSADFTIMAVLLHRLDSFSLRDVYKRQVLDRLGVNTCIQKMGDVGRPQQVRCHIEVQAIHNVGIVFLMSSQTRLNSVLDALSVHILIICLLYTSRCV